MKALQHLAPSGGQRLALVTLTGGPSVVSTDAFAKQGLEIPTLTEASYDKFRAFFSIVGGSYRNPVDMGMNQTPEHFTEIMQILLEDPHIDAVVNDFPLTFLRRRTARRPDYKAELFNTLTELCERYGTPLLAVVGYSPFEKDEVDFRKELLDIGIPAFHNFERAACAYRQVSTYHRLHPASSST